MANKFLGRGWAFPPTFDSSTKGVNMLEAEADIKNSLEVLLATRLGERVMRPRLGTSLNRMVFEPIDTSLATLLQSELEIAVNYYEPRIELDKVDVSVKNRLEGLVEIKLEYTVRSTNTRTNLVFPFYLEEGTNL